MKYGHKFVGANADFITYFNKEKDKNVDIVGKIAGGHKETVEAARNILRDGGNAFDAAVAGVFSSLVCEYLYTSAAGGGAMLVCKNNSSPVLVDFFVEISQLNFERILILISQPNLDLKLFLN